MAPGIKSKLLVQTCKIGYEQACLLTSAPRGPTSSSSALLLSVFCSCHTHCTQHFASFFSQISEWLTPFYYSWFCSNVTSSKKSSLTLLSIHPPPPRPVRSSSWLLLSQMILFIYLLITYIFSLKLKSGEIGWSLWDYYVLYILLCSTVCILSTMKLYLKIFNFYWFYLRETHTHTLICYSTHLCIHWLIPSRALPRHLTISLENWKFQRSIPTRAEVWGFLFVCLVFFQFCRELDFACWKVGPITRVESGMQWALDVLLNAWINKWQYLVVFKRGRDRAYKQ